MSDCVPRFRQNSPFAELHQTLFVVERIGRVRNRLSAVVNLKTDAGQCVERVEEAKHAPIYVYWLAD